MPEFSEPTTGVRESFLAAMAEFQAEGRGTESDESMIGREIREYGPTWTTQAGFAAYVRDLRAQALEETPRPEGFVPSTTLWWIDGPEYLGRLASGTGSPRGCWKPAATSATTYARAPAAAAMRRPCCAPPCPSRGSWASTGCS
jgi:hypothetical protein